MEELHKDKEKVCRCSCGYNRWALKDNNFNCCSCGATYKYQAYPQLSPEDRVLPPLSEFNNEPWRWRVSDNPREIIKMLLQAMRNWAHDEGGVHEDACGAYNRAAFFVGIPELKLVVNPPPPYGKEQS